MSGKISANAPVAPPLLKMLTGEMHAEIDRAPGGRLRRGRSMARMPLRDRLAFAIERLLNTRRSLPAMLRPDVHARPGADPGAAADALPEMLLGYGVPDLNAFA